MPKFSVVTNEYHMVTTHIVDADYMEIGHYLVFKNRSSNTAVAAFSDWLSVMPLEMRKNA